MMYTNKNNDSANTTAKAGFKGMLSQAQAIVKECAGLEFSIDRIRMPAGGRTGFVLPPKENGDPNEVTEISGVVIFTHPVNVYYVNPYANENNTPSCSSEDGIHGYGNPGGDCRECPFNRFGSNGRGKLCSNRRMLYILPEGELFPIMLSLPTASLRGYSDYVKYLIMKGRRPSAVVTTITIKNVINRNGDMYPQVVFALDRMLSEEEQKVTACAAELARAHAERLNVATMPIDPETGEIIEG